MTEKKVCSSCKYQHTIATIAEWGEIYSFCRICMAILDGHDEAGRAGKLVKGHLALSEEEKNFIEARKRRAEGKSLWNFDECSCPYMP